MVGGELCQIGSTLRENNKGVVMKLISFKSIQVFVLAVLLVACGGAPDATNNASSEAAPQTQLQWKMVTTWPKNFPGLGTGANYMAEAITRMSGGRLTVKVYGANELVGALEVFDAVSRGTAEMGHGAGYYWKGKTPAAQFFTAVPFGMNAQEMAGWLYYGGGMVLWEEVYAPFGILPLAAGNTGTQMGGWFNKEINSINDLQGLKMRIPGLGGEVLKRAGGVPVLVPGGEIFPSLQTGAIDATEWVGPYNDLAFGLHKAAKFYYYPGWQEPGPVLEAIVNKEAFDTLPEDLKAIVREAAKATYTDMLANYTAENNRALRTLVEEHGVQVRRFPEDVILRLRALSDQVLDEEAAQDPLTQRVYDSFKAFNRQVVNWHNISERALFEARDLGAQ